ncbi:MAG: trigger factor, partial [Smithellaceae bacterium]|nr:trigger factor [Smithellaceae bacterium]
MGELNQAVKIEDLSSVRKKLSFDVPWDDVKEAIDTIYRDLGKNAKIKGFRQGKVPKKVLEAYYKDHVSGEVVTSLVNKFYWKALDENKIVAVAHPQIEPGEIETGKNFAFTATVEVEPVIDPVGYTALELEKAEVEVTEGDVEGRLDRVRQMFATLEDVGEGRGAKESDFVTLDFEGTLDGEALKELKSENYFLEIGSKTFVPGLEEQLVGMKSCESKKIQVRFPEW